MSQSTTDPTHLVLSVVVPAFNAQAYLRDCIESVLKQTHNALEVIIVDDGSSDGTLAIARSLATEDSRVHVVAQPNGGAAAARNQGLRTATGEYIAFVDADDWVDSDMFERLISHVAITRYDAVSCDLTSHGPRGSRVESYPTRGGSFTRREIEEEILPYLISSRRLTRDWPFRMVTKIFRRQHLVTHEITFNEELRAAQDFTFAVEAMWRANTFYYVKGWAPYHYRWNPGSRTNSGLSSAWNNYRAVDHELSVLVSADPGFRSQLEVAALHGDLSVLTYLYKKHPLRGSQNTAQTMRSLLSSVDRSAAFDALEWDKLPPGKRMMCRLLRGRHYTAAHAALMVRAQADRVLSLRSSHGGTR